MFIKIEEFSLRGCLNFWGPRHCQVFERRARLCVYSWWARSAAERLQNFTYWLRHFSCVTKAPLSWRSQARGDPHLADSATLLCAEEAKSTRRAKKKIWARLEERCSILAVSVHSCFFPVNGVTPSHCWCQRLHSLPKKPRRALNAPLWKNCDLSSFSLADSLILPVAPWMSHQEAFCLMRCIM